MEGSSKYFKIAEIGSVLLGKSFLYSQYQPNREGNISRFIQFHTWLVLKIRRKITLKNENVKFHK